MTTSSASAVLAQTTQAQFDAWVQEIYTNLVTDCGLVQTNDTGQASSTFAGALPTGTGVGNATGYYMFTFNDSLAAGTLSTTALNSGGTGYDGGGTHTYTGITATGATSGATCTCSVTVTSGVCGNMSSIASSGNFIVGEKITIPASALGNNGGSGASWTATALSSGAPVIFRLDFGAGTATTDPQMWITVGAGTNGAGTIAGSAGSSRMTQVACFAGGAPLSTVTAYTSRYVWNSTYGYLGIAFKLGAIVGTTTCFGGLVLFRTNDNGGNSLSTAVVLITNSSTTTGASGGANSVMQCMSYSGGAGSTVYPTLSSTNSSYWTSLGGGGNGGIFGLTSTLENSVAFVAPIWTMDPALRFSAFNGVACTTDFPIGNTASFSMVGSTALTFISVGGMFGNSSFGSIGTANFTFVMLWQ